MGLKLKAQHELHDARGPLNRCEITESGWRSIPATGSRIEKERVLWQTKTVTINSSKALSVRYVEYVPAENDLLALGHAKRFGESRVKHDIARIAQDVPIPLFAWNWITVTGIGSDRITKEIRITGARWRGLQGLERHGVRLYVPVCGPSCIVIRLA